MDQAAVGLGCEPTAKEVAKKRLAIEAERRPVAEKRAELAREYARGLAAGTTVTMPMVRGLGGQPLREERANGRGAATASRISAP